MTYEGAVHFAQTWGMVYMFILFAAALVYALWPRSKKTFDDAAQMPLRED